MGFTKDLKKESNDYLKKVMIIPQYDEGMIASLSQ